MINFRFFCHCEQKRSNLLEDRHVASTPRDDVLVRGFTLVEIVIVIALIGALGTWMVSLIDPVAQFKKGRDAERKAELVQIQAALELYRADQNEYPPSPLPACGNPLEIGSVTYIQKVPCDSNDQIYIYERPTQTTYTLIACLENKNDPQKDEQNNSNCTGDTRSFTLTNP
jgi:prepilin-type N-terminal cleavage/methylation domain-containing protein